MVDLELSLFDWKDFWFATRDEVLSISNEINKLSYELETQLYNVNKIVSNSKEKTTFMQQTVDFLIEKTLNYDTQSNCIDSECKHYSQDDSRLAEARRNKEILANKKDIAMQVMKVAENNKKILDSINSYSEERYQSIEKSKHDLIALITQYAHLSHSYDHWINKLNEYILAYVQCAKLR